MRLRLEVDSDDCEEKRIRWTIAPLGDPSTKIKVTGGRIMYQMTDDSKGAALTLTLVDAKGNPAVPASPPTWTESSGGTILDLVVAADGMSATIAPVGPLGSAQVNVTVEGDPKPGKDTQTGTLAVTVVAGEVATVTINPTPLV